MLGLFSGELIFGGAYYWKEFCDSKWVGLGNKTASTNSTVLGGSRNQDSTALLLVHKFCFVQCSPTAGILNKCLDKKHTNPTYTDTACESMQFLWLLLQSFQLFRGREATTRNTSALLIQVIMYIITNSCKGNCLECKQTRTIHTDTIMEFSQGRNDLTLLPTKTKVSSNLKMVICIQACIGGAICIQACIGGAICIQACIGGAICMQACIGGTICMQACIGGTICMQACIGGTICMQACIGGTICMQACIGGTICIQACIGGKICMQTCIGGHMDRDAEC